MSIFVSAAPGYAKDLSKEKCKLGLLIPRLSEKTRLPKIKLVKTYLSARESSLRSQLNFFIDDPFQAPYRIHSDPLACRLCVAVSKMLISDLENQFPKQTWIQIETNKTIGGYYHVYIYCPDLDLVVDATYRQFLIELPKSQFKKLPGIFVGSPDEYRAAFFGELSEKQLRKLLDPI